VIKVTVELISANDGHTETLGQGIIYNDATGTWKRGNYQALFSRRGGFKRPKSATSAADQRNVWRSTDVKDFPRERYNVWFLLAEALKNARVDYHLRGN
jgi:hypothetical protein